MCAVLSFDDVDVISYDTSNLDFGDLGAWCGRECLTCQYEQRGGLTRVRAARRTAVRENEESIGIKEDSRENRAKILVT